MGADFGRLEDATVLLWKELQRLRLSSKGRNTVQSASGGVYGREVYPNKQSEICEIWGVIKIMRSLPMKG